MLGSRSGSLTDETDSLDDGNLRSISMSLGNRVLVSSVTASELRKTSARVALWPRHFEDSDLICSLLGGSG